MGFFCNYLDDSGYEDLNDKDIWLCALFLFLFQEEVLMSVCQRRLIYGFIDVSSSDDHAIFSLTCSSWHMEVGVWPKHLLTPALFCVVRNFLQIGVLLAFFLSGHQLLFYVIYAFLISSLKIYAHVIGFLV